jgi:hypothetical protein
LGRLDKLLSIRTSGDEAHCFEVIAVRFWETEESRADQHIESRLANNSLRSPSGASLVLVHFPIAPIAVSSTHVQELRQNVEVPFLFPYGYW